MKKVSDGELAYVLARLGLGINMGLHGFTRLPNLKAFAAKMQEDFAATILPSVLVGFSAYGIAITEAVIGVMILLGWKLKSALIVGCLLMNVLLFGTCLIQNWGVAGSQMIYLAYFAAMLALVKWDRYSIDRLR